MKALEYERPLTVAGIQALLLIGCGVALAWLIVHASPLAALAVFLAVALVAVFIQRPDLGLLLVLAVRSSSDVLIQGRQSLGASYDAFTERLTSSPNVGLIAILILGGALFIITHRVRLPRLPGALPLGFWLITGTVGMLHAPSLLKAVDRWLAVCTALVVYALAAALFREARRIQKVIDVIMLSFIAPALTGLYQYATGQGFYNPIEQVSRVQATFVHPGPFGTYLVIMFSVFLCQALAQKGVRKRMAVVFLITSAFLLALSITRAALAGALVVVLVVAALRKRTLILLVPPAIAIAVALVPSIATRFNSNPFGEHGSFADRQTIWRGAYHAWLDSTYVEQSPFATVLKRLAGTAPGSVPFLTVASGGSRAVAHDDYLGVLFEYGALGLMAFLAMTVSLIVGAYRTWRQTTDRTMEAVALSFFAITVAYPLMYFTSNVVSYTQNQLYFWTLAGLTAAIAQMNSGRNSTRTDSRTIS